MRIVLSAAAEADLEEIGDYIAKDDARRALTFVRDLRNAALRLADMPHAYPLVPRSEHHAIRRRPFGTYLIFYRVEDTRVIIVDILHGARDYETILFSEG